MCSHFYLLQSQQVNKWCAGFDLFVEVIELKSEVISDLHAHGLCYSPKQMPKESHYKRHWIGLTHRMWWRWWKRDAKGWIWEEKTVSELRIFILWWKRMQNDCGYECHFMAQRWWKVMQNWDWFNHWCRYCTQNHHKLQRNEALLGNHDWRQF